MNFLNFNFLHNVLNVAIATLTALLLSSGCVQSATGALTCAASWISPEITAVAVLGLSVLKIVMNVFRDGLGGLIKPQPPVPK